MSDTPKDDIVSLTWLGSPGAGTSSCFFLSGVSLKFNQTWEIIRSVIYLI